MDAAPHEGVVIEVRGQSSLVRCEGATLVCDLRGRVKREGEGGRANPVAVGDRVRIAAKPDAESEGVIEEVLPRRTSFSRLHASAEEGAPREQVICANLDHVCCVVATKGPPYRTGFVDRVACVAELRGLDLTIVVNKIDLGKRLRVERDFAVYRDLGYATILASAKTGEGIDGLRERLASRITVFSGHSGVGKSSLLNAVQPGLALKVGRISGSTSKGRHTTSRITLLPLDGGGYVADTPGVRAFGLWNVDARDVGRGFREIAAAAQGCRFRDCRHLDEPECAVVHAVADGSLGEARYASYVRILESLGETVPDEADEP